MLLPRPQEVSDERLASLRGIGYPYHPCSILNIGLTKYIIAPVYAITLQFILITLLRVHISNRHIALLAPQEAVDEFAVRNDMSRR